MAHSALRLYDDLPLFTEELFAFSIESGAAPDPMHFGAPEQQTPEALVAVDPFPAKQPSLWPLPPLRRGSKAPLKVSIPSIASGAMAQRVQGFQVHSLVDH